MPHKMCYHDFIQRSLNPLFLQVEILWSQRKKNPKENMIFLMFLDNKVYRRSTFMTKKIIKYVWEQKLYGIRLRRGSHLSKSPVRTSGILDLEAVQSVYLQINYEEMLAASKAAYKSVSILTTYQRYLPCRAEMVLKLA